MKIAYMIKKFKDKGIIVKKYCSGILKNSNNEILKNRFGYISFESMSEEQKEYIRKILSSFCSNLVFEEDIPAIYNCVNVEDDKMIKNSNFKINNNMLNDMVQTSWRELSNSLNRYEKE